MTALAGYRGNDEIWPGRAVAADRSVAAVSTTLDAAFARSAGTGDRAPFTALMTQHKHWLCRYVLRYVGSMEDARDIVQNCFVMAWSARATYDPAWPFHVWLRRIALNKCHDFGRRRKAYRAVVGALGLCPEALQVVDPAVEIDRITRREGAVERLHASITQLPPTLRDPLILTALEGLSHKQAAAVLELSVKAVELRVRRARQQLALSIDATDIGELAEGGI